MRWWRARRRVAGDDAGFGTVEWVLIGFFVAGMAIFLGALLFNAVSDKGSEVENCIAGATGCNP